MVKRVAVLVFTFFIVGIARYAQKPDSIGLGGTTLKLGDTQASVLQQLAKNYNVNETQGLSAPGFSLWLVEEKIPPKIPIGNVAFRNRKLSGAYKYWTLSQPNTATAFANDLDGAILSST